MNDVKKGIKILLSLWLTMALFFFGIMSVVILPMEFVRWLMPNWIMCGLFLSLMILPATGWGYYLLLKHAIMPFTTSWYQFTPIYDMLDIKYGTPKKS